MSNTAVLTILDQIRQLSAVERNQLDEQLAKLEEVEWREEATRARRAARREGLDQGAIDRAVERARYGS